MLNCSRWCSVFSRAAPRRASQPRTTFCTREARFASSGVYERAKGLPGRQRHDGKMRLESGADSLPTDAEAASPVACIGERVGGNQFGSRAAISVSETRPCLPTAITARTTVPIDSAPSRIVLVRSFASLRVRHPSSHPRPTLCIKLCCCCGGGGGCSCGGGGGGGCDGGCDGVFGLGRGECG